MNEKQIYVSIGLLIIFLVVSFSSITRILKSKHLEKNQKKMNIVMIFLFPILWGLFILILFSKPKKKKDDGYQYREAGYSNYTRWK
tara:strand:+ start:930 stop:1187 length:258 start_codon:yes stop_codon:yes gene_type:complete